MEEIGGRKGGDRRCRGRKSALAELGVGCLPLVVGVDFREVGVISESVGNLWVCEVDGRGGGTVQSRRWEEVVGAGVGRRSEETGGMM